MKIHEDTLHLSPTDLAGHLSCQHLTQLQRAVAHGRMPSPARKDPRLEAMRERGLRHEQEYVERLRAGGRDIHDLRGNHDPAATLAAMQQGAGAIVQAPLQHGRFRGTADVLLRVETASARWAWSYEPVDTKLGRETKAGTILQLCTYADMLRHVQGTVPEHVWAITPHADEPYRTADYAAYFRFVQRRLENAATTTATPHTYPDPVPHCDVCSFWAHCDHQRRADDHPSLVANIHTLHIRELQRQKIPTLTALAGTDGALPEPPERGRPDAYQRLASQAALQLQARTLPLPPCDDLPPEPGRGLARLPAPDPGDVFLDFEGDPFAGNGDGGLEYLTGWGFYDDAHRWHYQPAWATDRAAERNATLAFLHFVQDRLTRHPDLHVYHYGVYEPAALKRTTARHAAGADILDQLLRGQRFVDLHQVVREGLRIGVERYGLKELEPLHGFTREFDLRDAALARRDVEIALELGNLDDLTDELRQQVTDYNREDCLSTAKLRDWLEARRAALGADGAQLPRPVLASGEPTEKVGERDQRLQAAAERLRQGLPEDPAQRTEDQHAKALLAQMLGYFRREEKCGWWEHYRLRELDDHDLLDEREALSGLQFVEEIPQFGKRGNRILSLHRYRFPPQESAIKVGDELLPTLSAGDLEGEVGTVAAIDPGNGTIDIKITRASEDWRPSAVFGKQTVGAKALESSLLAFADLVATNGFPESGPFAAAADLLRRRMPRRTGGVGGPLRQENEDLGAATIRLCRELDHGVLPIQGPPGSGKSHTGAKAILALLGDGKRVGITAVSHKVIDNLLEKVGELAAKDGVAVRLVHCDRNGGDGQGIDYRDNAAALAAVGPGCVVGGTAWLWASDAGEEALDFLFVDEAGQMSLAQVLAAARGATNLVLLGDPQQLEQPRRGAHPDGAEVAALVHVLGKDVQTMPAERGLFLDQTWRLHPQLCAFTSAVYYEDRLAPRPGLEQMELRDAGPFCGAGLFLREVAHAGNQASAPEEVAAVLELVAHLFRGKPRWFHPRDGERPLTPDDVMVVAPYNAQVAALQRALLPLSVTRVGTVDRFQGQEAPLVIYSCTSSSVEDAPRGMSFLFDPHRFNVATSRAQAVVVVVASPRLFEAECRTPEQMRWANGLCAYRERAGSGLPR